MKSIGAGKRFENMQKYNKQGSEKVTGASVFIRHQKRNMVYDFTSKIFDW